MKRALVTGSAGFIGRHFVRHLEEAGWTVNAWDIADHMDARKMFTWAPKPFDLVVHAAYWVGGRAAIDGKNINLALNLELDSMMFRWAHETNQRHVLYFSSSAAYPVEYQTAQWVKQWGADDARLTENDITLSHPLPPDANYGWAKLTGERMAAAARENGLKVSVVRPFSGYGEDQSLDYPFPSIIARVLKGDYSVWGPVGQTRDWIHIDDVIAACMAVVESGTADPVNLCTGISTEMGDLVRTVAMVAHGLDPQGYPSVDDIEVTYQPYMPTGVFHRVGDPSLMTEFHIPKVDLEQGIHRALRYRI